jgi:hypothetical protein
MRRRRSDATAPALFALVVLVGGCWWRDVPASPSCPRDRTIVLSSQTEVDTFATCTSASGVVVRGFEAVDTSGLRALETIEGDLVIGPSTSTEDITLTELHEVGGSVRVVGNDLLRGVFLPRLVHAGRIEVDGNLSLHTVSLPSLETVDNTLTITDNKELGTIDASSLATIGQGITIAGQPRLVTLVLPVLAHAATITLQANPKLPPDTESALRAKLMQP